jgi:hypothetical protein
MQEITRQISNRSPALTTVLRAAINKTYVKMCHSQSSFLFGTRELTDTVLPALSTTKIDNSATACILATRLHDYVVYPTDAARSSETSVHFY